MQHFLCVSIFSFLFFLSLIDVGVYKSGSHFLTPVVPCWRYLLRITDSATQSFTLALFPTSMVGITIALSQPVLTLTALTMALPCRFSDCN
jgi:hypothetical protein